MIDLNKTPELVLNKFTTSGIGSIQNDLCSRQVISIPYDDRIFIHELLSEYEREAFLGISPVGECIDFSQVPDNIIKACEYNCSSKFFTVPLDYMTYIKRMQPTYIKVIVYGAEFKLQELHPIIDTRVRKELLLPKLPEMDLSGELEYLSFKETSYNRIPVEGHEYYVLNTNLPYSYYSRIPLIDSVFNYDIDSQEFYDGDDIIKKEKMLEHFLRIHNDTLVPEIFPKISILANDNKLIPSHTERNDSDILLAKLLKVPYLPVSLIISDWKIPFPVIERRPSPISTEETNKICKPYFFFPE